MQITNNYEDYAERFEDLVLRYSRPPEAPNESRTAGFDAALSETEATYSHSAEIRGQGASSSEVLREYARIRETGRRDAVLADPAHRYSRIAEVLRHPDAAFAGTEDIYSRAKSTAGRDTLIAGMAQKLAYTADGRYDEVLAEAAQRNARAKEISGVDAVITDAAKMYSMTMDVSARYDAVLAMHRDSGQYLG